MRGGGGYGSVVWKISIRGERGGRFFIQVKRLFFAADV